VSDHTNIVKEINGKAVYSPGDDIDTDRIIPARFIRCVTFDGLGQYSFYDQRFDGSGNPLDHPLNRKEARESVILIVGRNFGCGSSREHAPQALYRFGFRGIIGESFGEIFAGNCVSLGFPAVVLEESYYKKFMEIYKSDPGAEMKIDLKERFVGAGDEKLPFILEESSLRAFLSGKWDTMNELLEGMEDIEKKYRELPYLNRFQK
jgi:3-isopropylmalate/(R)-2-methylmalate dehydratase small subunit